MILFNTPMISPIEEIAAYETLWESEKASFKRIAEIFKNNPGGLPSDFLTQENESRFFENKEKL